MLQPDLGIHAGATTRLGFGCASLGSRISRSDALRALERAFDAGITWFDVAPSYGDGNAEAILGEFAARHHGAVNVCTKVGIVARPAGWKALVRPAARAVIHVVPALRRHATRARAVANLPLSPDGVTASVEASLSRLGVERIDMLMLHDPDPADVLRDDLRQTLERLKSDGKVHHVGVAGDMDAARNGASAPELYSALQFANNIFDPNVEVDFVAAWRHAGKLVITHSALGAYTALPRLTRQLAADRDSHAALEQAGYTGTDAAMAAAFLTDYALATNRGGIALFSAAGRDHLAALVARARSAPDATHIRNLAVTLASRSPAFA